MTLLRRLCRRGHEQFGDVDLMGMRYCDLRMIAAEVPLVEVLHSGKMTLDRTVAGHIQLRISTAHHSSNDVDGK